MKTKNFSFEIPEELIAQYPEARGKSRLLLVDRARGQFYDDQFTHIAGLLPENAVLVLNDSKVRKARFFADSETGAGVEFILLNKTGPKEWETIVSKSKRQKAGRKYSFPAGVTGEITGTSEKTKTIRFSEEIGEQYLELHGNMPLPPYIKRHAEIEDDTSYQTVYADAPGSAAAPTAGLHFSEDLLKKTAARGIRLVYVTLHVGIGTFLPIRTDSIVDHKMHEETYSIGSEEAAVISAAKKENRPVIAVGTTSVRTLESAFQNGKILPGTGSTGLYIYPGYKFKALDGLITNFHTPESSLFVMVSAFAGLDLMKKAYAYAVRKKYRFFSYGDAMYIPPV